MSFDANWDEAREIALERGRVVGVFQPCRCGSYKVKHPGRHQSAAGCDILKVECIGCDRTVEADDDHSALQNWERGR